MSGKSFLASHCLSPFGFALIACCALLGNDGAADDSVSIPGTPAGLMHTHHGRDPVNVNTGDFYLPVDSYVDSCGGGVLRLTRAYNSLSESHGSFGIGWTFEYDARIEAGTRGKIAVRESDGFETRYTLVDSMGIKLPQVADSIVAAKIREDLGVTRHLSDIQRSFYDTYRAHLMDDEAYFRHQRMRYLGTLLFSGGHFESRERGTSSLEQTREGFLRMRSWPQARSERFDSLGALIRVEAESSSVLVLSRDEKGRLRRITGPCGHWLDIAEDGDNLIREVVHSSGARMSFHYDEQKRLILSVGADGDTVRYKYDGKDRLTTLLFPDGSRTEVSYDPLTGRTIEQVGPGSKVTRYHYGWENDHTWAEVEDNEGLRNRYEYYRQAKKIVLLQKDGHKSVNMFTGCGCDVGDTTRVFNYDPSGHLTVVTSNKGDSLSLRYGNAGKVDVIDDPSSADLHLSYDTSGRLDELAIMHLGQRLDLMKVHYDVGGKLRVENTTSSNWSIEASRGVVQRIVRLLLPEGEDAVTWYHSIAPVLSWGE